MCEVNRFKTATARRGKTRQAMTSAVAGVGAICCDSRVTPARKHAAAASGTIEQLGAARRERLDELFKRHSTYVARLAYRLMGRDADVDDIVQDVFVLLFRRIDTIRQADAVQAWLATTTVRLTRRRMRVKRVALLLGFADHIDAVEIEGASDAPEARAALQVVHAALQAVSVNARIAWILRYLEQERIEDVARLCGCSKTTAKRWIAAAQRVVKDALSDD
jgi:RNA polymerase sigma-70 factor (ECF subfamily)